jgi:uncharacterized protein YgfB (UPF0149 family)
MTAPGQSAAPDYPALAAIMQRCGMAQSPAESQGFALGLFVAGVPDPRLLWQQELYSDFDPADVLAGECRAVLDQVFANVFAAEDPTAMQLTLLLPQDIVVDSARVGAVRDWCQGFLFGFGLAGRNVAERLSDQSRELLHDIAEMTRLDTDDVENSTENQSALIEIEEFLRVGVMLMRDDLSKVNDQHESE